MLLDEPSWWYRSQPNTVAKLLEPIGVVYGWTAKTRYFQTRSHKSQLPIVCIGNFTAGGVGKTPLVLHLCARLKAAGHHPVALTRGYGGRLAGPHWVDAERDIARDIGDEAQLLARLVPTLLSRDRHAGALAIERGPHRATIVIMDDGLQNASLAKDLTIAVVDGSRGVGNGKVIPAGPLRASLEMQLALTDAVVVNEPMADQSSQVTEWLRHRFTGPVLQAITVPADAADWLNGTRVIAWAGIGAPGRFFTLVEKHRATIVERIAFPDHHVVTRSEAHHLLSKARDHSAVLVTTEKDMTRLRGEAGPLAELAKHSRPLPVQLQFSDLDGERLAILVDAALERRLK